MKKSKFSVDQIIGILNQLESGMNVKDLARQNGISDQTIYRWKNKYGGMDVNEAKRLKDLESENRQLKEMIADLSLQNKILKDVNSKKW